MLFASIVFIFFFLPLCILWHGAARTISGRNLILLAMSLLFYFWGENWRILILIFIIAVNYFLALGLNRWLRFRKPLFIVGISLNLLFLLNYKYSYFIFQSVNELFTSLNLNIQIHAQPVHLPLGISFITFHALSYLIDTYNYKVPAERNFLTLSLYFFLFPHQIAGPIVRYDHFAEQAYNRRFGLPGFQMGLERFLIGLSKKVLVANLVAPFADHVFSLSLNDISTPLAWLGILAYTFQIYFDFSGYSDMAIGLARMFGFHFHENFNFPYSAQSITEFWRRWHISLSSWFRDYVYIPLGGNRSSGFRIYCNLTLVFLLCGFWHGANWTFIVWGLWHGLFLVVERTEIGVGIKSKKMVGWIWTALIVILGWVFFRAETLHFASGYIARLFQFAGIVGDSDFHWHDLMTQRLGLLGMLLASILCFEKPNQLLRNFFAKDSKWLTPREGLLLVLFILCTIRLATASFNPFIYFRF